MAGKGATTQKMSGGTLNPGAAESEDKPYDAEAAIKRLTKRVKNLELVNDTRLRSRGLID